MSCNMTNKKENLIWVDAIKFICLLLVFINHSEIYSSFRFEWGGYFYRPIFVNAFFIISGYLLFRKQWNMSMLALDRREWFAIQGGGRTLFSNIFFKLAIPTVLFSFINFFPKKLLRGQAINISDLFFDTLGGCSIWFTTALTVAEIVICVILLSRASKKVMAIMLIVICVIGSYLMGLDFAIVNKTFPWYYKSGLTACGLLVFGGFLSQYSGLMDRLTRMDKRYMLAVCLSAIYFLLCYYGHGYLDTALDWQGLNILGFVASAIGTLTMICWCSYLPFCKFINFIGKHSIGFYFFCGSVVNVIASIGVKFLGHNTSTVIVVALTSFIISMVLVWFLNKYLPWVYDLRKLRKSQSRNELLR